MKYWLQVMKKNIIMKNIILNIIFFADDHVTVASTEDEMQRTVYAVKNIAIKVF